MFQIVPNFIATTLYKEWVQLMETPFLAGKSSLQEEAVLILEILGAADEWRPTKGTLYLHF